MPFDEDTINYGKTPADDVIVRLQKRIDSGEATLRHDEQRGYLPGVLEALGISPASQMLVFSKTSFQRERIGPHNPRALYFNDSVYIGFVPGSPLLEIASVDPKLGGVFYTLEQSRVEKPKFVRNDQCLECHASAKTMGVPGHLVRSFLTDDIGVVDLGTGVSIVNHRTPIAERWGGWFVTGNSGSQPHRGNLIGKTEIARHDKEPTFKSNLPDLAQLINTRIYPEPTSDIAALLLFEHQSHMHNFITRLGFESTISIEQYGHIRYLKSITEAFLKYMLFTEEAPFAAPIQGSQDFARWFSSQGPRDSKGRSLRDLDLKTHLLKYPCSYLIYSEAFDRLPPMIRQHILERLLAILTGKDASPDFKSIPADTRLAILEILRETKPRLPEAWKTASR